jgi:hypothetical protein
VYRAVLERIRALPGVESASLASSVSFGMFSDGREIQRPGAGRRSDTGPKPAEAGDLSTNGVTAAGRATPVAGDAPVYASYVIVSDDYFRSLGTAMLRGREFDRLEAGGGASAPVAIVNEVAARRLWPDGEAVGRQFEIRDARPDAQAQVLTVVGIAPSFRAQLGDEQPTPHFYVPVGQAFQAWVNLHVRVASTEPGADRALVATIRTALREVDDQLPLLSINTLGDFHNEGMVMWMFKAGTRVFLVFGGLALALAVVGVYGLKSFVVARRTRELGIRLALGATKRQVLWLVLRDGLKLTAAGLAVGLPLALVVGQVLGSAFYRVNRADPGVFLAALGVLTLAALLASYLPARRAAAVQPMVALRSE